MSRSRSDLVIDVGCVERWVYIRWEGTGLLMFYTTSSYHQVHGYIFSKSNLPFTIRLPLFEPRLSGNIHRSTTSSVPITFNMSHSTSMSSTAPSSLYAASTSSKKPLLSIFSHRKCTLFPGVCVVESSIGNNIKIVASESSTAVNETTKTKAKKTKQHFNNEPFWAASATYMATR
jgi:hypothetical protein